MSEEDKFVLVEKYIVPGLELKSKGGWRVKVLSVHPLTKRSSESGLKVENTGCFFALHYPTPNFPSTYPLQHSMDGKVLGTYYSAVDPKLVNGKAVKPLGDVVGYWKCADIKSDGKKFTYTFEIFQRSDGFWSCRVVHPNGNIICSTTKKYKTKINCKLNINNFLFVMRSGGVNTGVADGSLIKSTNKFILLVETFLRKDKKYDFRVLFKQIKDIFTEKRESALLLSSNQGYENHSDLVSIKNNFLNACRMSNYAMKIEGEG